MFHVECFSCQVCSIQLSTGDYFGHNDNSIYCRLHYRCDTPPDEKPLLPDKESGEEDETNDETFVKSVFNDEERFFSNNANKYSRFNFPSKANNPPSPSHLFSRSANSFFPFPPSPFSRNNHLCCEAADPETSFCYLHSLPYPLPPPNSSIRPLFHHSNSQQKGRPRKRKTTLPDMDGFVPSLGECCTNNYSVKFQEFEYF